MFSGTVTATLDEITPEDEEEEDTVRRDPRLRLSAPGQTGGQIVAGLLSQPGGVAEGTCFSVHKLGNAMYSQLRIMRTTLLTTDDGAQGGDLTFIETTGLGTCAVILDTTQGQSAGEIAQALEDLILQVDATPKPFCPETMNPRDINRVGDSIINVFASSLQICINDPGIGFSIAPEEVGDVAIPPLSCDPNAPGAIIGTAGNDILVGTAGDDVIIALGGNDRIEGGGGNDCIDAGAGNDRVNSGSGNDLVLADSGNNRITTGAGDDRIVTGDGNDIISSGSGNDIVVTGAGNDRITTGEGDDRIHAGDGNDHIDSGIDTDNINGGEGTNFCTNGETTTHCKE